MISSMPSFVEVHQQPVVLAIGRPMGDDGGGEPVRAPILVLPHGLDALPDQLLLASLPTYRAKDEGTRGGFCKQIFDTAKLSEESLDAAAWTLETVKIAMHNQPRPARERRGTDADACACR